MYNGKGRANKWTLITKSDSAIIEYDAFYLETAGNLKFMPIGNTAAVTVALEKGYHPVPIKMVYATGSDAVNVYGLNIIA